MELTKRRLKEIIAEEMNHLAETGDPNMITEAEKKAFAIILEKLTPKQLPSNLIMLNVTIIFMVLLEISKKQKNGFNNVLR